MLTAKTLISLGGCPDLSYGIGLELFSTCADI